MKKTLIALAAVAVSTGAMAQATISGKVDFDFAQTENSNGTFGVGNADITFAASEDLGGGLTATASVGLELAPGRGTQTIDNGQTNAPDGTYANTVGNITLAISSADFGTVTMGRVEAGNGIVGRGTGGASAFTLGADNGIVLTGDTNTNIVSYASPRVMGVQIGGNFTQAAGIFGNTTARASYTPAQAFAGEGFAYSLSANYSEGPISAGIDYHFTAERTRMSASYDLGVATIGAGYEMRKFGGAGDGVVVGATVPLGAVTLGASYAQNMKKRTTSGNAGVEDAAVFDFGASYALSKRTSIQAAYQHSMDGGNGAGDPYKYRVRVSHSF